MSTKNTTNQDQDQSLPYANDAGKCAICGKPILGGKPGDIGKTCSAHQGKIGKFYQTLIKMPDPKEFATLVQLCDLAEKRGKSRYFAVKLTGKDGGAQAPISKIFTVFVWQGRKYVKVEALKELEKLTTKE